MRRVPVILGSQGNSLRKLGASSVTRDPIWGRGGGRTPASCLLPAAGQPHWHTLAQLQPLQGQVSGEGGVPPLQGLFQAHLEQKHFVVASAVFPYSLVQGLQEAGGDTVPWWSAGCSTATRL